jgi:hypothetical protein
VSSSKSGTTPFYAQAPRARLISIWRLREIIEIRQIFRSPGRKLVVAEPVKTDHRNFEPVLSVIRNFSA